MYAVVGIWNVEPRGWEEEQLRALKDQVVPGVQQRPGFVAGYWMADQAARKTYGTFILEHEAAAQGFKAFVEGNAAARERSGVILESLTVAEVIAEAHR